MPGRGTSPVPVRRLSVSVGSPNQNSEPIDPQRLPRGLPARTWRFGQKEATAETWPHLQTLFAGKYPQWPNETAGGRPDGLPTIGA